MPLLNQKTPPLSVYLRPVFLANLFREDLQEVIEIFQGKLNRVTMNTMVCLAILPQIQVLAVTFDRCTTLSRAVDSFNPTPLQVQWNLRIKDTLGAELCPLFAGCPLVGGSSQ